MDSAIAQAETALRAAAREHKQLEFAHRKAARRLYEQADALHKAALAQLGIGLRTIGTDEKESEP